MQIRDLQSEDVDVATEIAIRCNGAYRDWAPADWAPPATGVDGERPGWEEILADDDAWGLAAIAADGEPVGVAGADGNGELRRLFVDPDWQGKGVGSQLLDRIEAGLVARGVTRSTLWTPAGSRAIGFYEARGWRLEDGTRWHERLQLTLVEMSKSLAPRPSQD